MPSNCSAARCLPGVGKPCPFREGGDACCSVVVGEDRRTEIGGASGPNAHGRCWRAEQNLTTAPRDLRSDGSVPLIPHPSLSLTSTPRTLSLRIYSPRRILRVHLGPTRTMADEGRKRVARPTHASHTSSISALGNLSSGVPTDLLLALLLDKTLLASSALLARHWLLVRHAESTHEPMAAAAAAKVGAAISAASASGGPWAIAAMVLTLAAVGQAVWFRIWQWLPALRRSDPNMQVLPRKLGVLALVLFAHLVVWLMALQRLGATT